jgi:hypothetical protein
VNTAGPMVTVSGDDAEELVELLEFVDDWLRRDYHRVGRLLFTHCAYDIADLRHDLARFISLLGGPADRLIQGDRR